MSQPPAPPSEPLPEFPILPDPAPLPPPASRSPLLSRGDRICAILFTIFLAAYWIGTFVFGLYHDMSLVMVMLLLLALILGLAISQFVSAVTGFAAPPNRNRRFRIFFSRLGILVPPTAIFSLSFAFASPRDIGLLYAAKWGVGLENVRRLQESPEVQALARQPDGGSLEKVPDYLTSRFWGEARVYVHPGTTSPPAVDIFWGGGFGNWGIFAGPPDSDPPRPDSIIYSPWTNGVWVYVEP